MVAMDGFSGTSSAAGSYCGGPSPSPSLHRWELAMRRVQESARSGQPQQAERTARAALQEAQGLLEHPSEGREEDCVAAFVVSHHVLADLHASEGAIETAAHLRCTAHERLLALLANCPQGAAVQQAAWRHSRATHSELLHHAAEHGVDPAITQVLEAGCRALMAAGSGPVPH